MLFISMAMKLGSSLLNTNTFTGRFNCFNDNISPIIIVKPPSPDREITAIWTCILSTYCMHHCVAMEPWFVSPMIRRFTICFDMACSQITGVPPSNVKMASSAGNLLRRDLRNIEGELLHHPGSASRSIAIKSLGIWYILYVLYR